VASAISWFFEHEEQGIILEDDCLPDLSFFQFCDELLELHKGDTRIMQVAGFNLISGKYDPGVSYFFSHLGWQWGWATWRRAWRLFDLEMKGWPAFKGRFSFKYYPLENENINLWNQMYSGQVSTWDYQWAFAMRSNYGLSVVPTLSLVENIGFGKDGTHTLGHPDGNKVIRNTIEFPLVREKFVYPDIVYDKKALRARARAQIKRKIFTELRTLIKKLFGFFKNCDNRISSTEKVFSKIYKEAKWSGSCSKSDYSSGAGSRSPEIVDQYLKDLSRYLKMNCGTQGVIVDLGCGDFSVGARLEGLYCEYIGVDVVPEIIEHNTKIFGEEHIRFLHLDIVNDPLPDGDICIIRQVFQHLSNKQILRCLRRLHKYKHVIISEHIPECGKLLRKNLDKVQGSGTRLDMDSGVYLDAKPFNIPASKLSEVSSFLIRHPITGASWGLLHTVDYQPSKA
jgi:hypothetical protein